MLLVLILEPVPGRLNPEARSNIFAEIAALVLGDAAEPADESDANECTEAIAAG